MKSTPTLALLTILLASTLPGAAQRADSPEALLGAGLHQEEVEDDCRAALRIYERVTRQSTVPREIAARAWLHTGLCRERLGQADARQAYERVVKQYGDQTAVLALARARLDAPSAAAAVTHRGLQRVAAEFVRGGGAISPDGRYLFSPHPGVRLFDVLKRTEAYTNAEGSLVGIPYGAFSPDSQSFAYSLTDARDGRPAGATVGEIRVSRLPSNYKPGAVVFRSQEFVVLVPFGWSRDARTIFALMIRKDETGVIAAISAADGAFTVVKRLEGERPGGLSVSPDGRFIAYDAPAGASSANHDIFLLSADGRSESPLVVNPARDAMPLWTPDGNAVVFRSDRSGKVGLWGVEVFDGKTRGPARLLREDADAMWPLGFARDGSFFYQTPTPGKPAPGSTPSTGEVEAGAGILTSGLYREVWADAEILPNHQRQHIFIAPIDPTTSRVHGVIEPLSGSLLVAEWGPRWSPDARSIAFTRNGELEAGRMSQHTVIRSLASRAERSLSVIARQWFSDGRRLLYTRNPGGMIGGVQQRAAILQVDVESGASTEIVSNRFGPVIPSPDDGTLYALSTGPRSAARNAIVAFAVATGKETGRIPLPVTSFGANVSYESLSLSPDGRTFAIWTDHGLFRVGIDGTGYRELYPADPPDWGTRPVWTRDGRGILIAVRDDNQIWRLLRVPAAGGTATFTGLEVRGYQDFDVSFDVSSDGTRLVFDGIAPKIVSASAR